MKIISQDVRTFYKYDGKYYCPSERKSFALNDIFVDFRDGNMKMVQSNKDLVDTSFMAPEWYYIVEEATIQN